MILVNTVTAEETTPIMPLAEIVPGMQGTWKTVVSGTTIDTFNLTIIGIADNFVGPKQSLILAEAMDASQILSGPVGGMSGSPVYIDGKLIGAYAYGFLWPKEQAIIGITPIEAMYDILAVHAGGTQEASLDSASWSPPTWYPNTDAMTDRSLQTVDRPVMKDHRHWTLRASAQASTASEWETVLQAVPTPMFVAGVSAKTLAVFADKFEELGLDVMQAPMGTAKPLDDVPLEPGAAVAGVLMNGDFSFARVGTVTWRQGDTILAFGHAMASAGGVQLPMAPAEVITVVRNLEDSFKLSNVGEAIGMIYQDRLSGVAGKVGVEAPTTPMHIRLNLAHGDTRDYRGNVALDRTMTPLVSAIALLESLTATLDAEFEQTFFVNIHMAINGTDDLHMRDVISGQQAAVRLARGFMGIYDSLLNNPFEVADVTRINVEVDVEPGMHMHVLQAVERLSGPVKGGDTFRIAATLDRYQAAPTRQVITIPLPQTMEPQHLQLLIADATAADAYDLGKGKAGFIESLDGLVDYLNRRRSSQKLYVKLLQASEGIRIHDTHLYDLPPSVRKLMQSPRSVRAGQSKVPWKTILETAIDFESPVSGSYRMPVDLE